MLMTKIDSMLHILYVAFSFVFVLKPGLDQMLALFSYCIGCCQEETPVLLLLLLSQQQQIPFKLSVYSSLLSL